GSRRHVWIPRMRDARGSPVLRVKQADNHETHCRDSQELGQAQPTLQASCLPGHEHLMRALNMLVGTLRCASSVELRPQAGISILADCGGRDSTPGSPRSREVISSPESLIHSLPESSLAGWASSMGFPWGVWRYASAQASL